VGSKQWRRAAEQSNCCGERWRSFPQPNGAPTSRAPRLATLGDEPSGSPTCAKYALWRARAFDVSAPVGAVRDVRRWRIDTLQAFLRDIRKRYPDAAPVVLEAEKPAAPKPAVARRRRSVCDECGLVSAAGQEPAAMPGHDADRVDLEAAEAAPRDPLAAVALDQ
jgi:hypothetical protein